MTIRELYEWAEAHSVLDYEISVNGNDGCETRASELYVNENVREVEVR